jgi:hypothetical protein
MTPPVPMRLIAYSHSLKYLCTNEIVGAESICQPFNKEHICSSGPACSLKSSFISLGCAPFQIIIDQ